MVIVEHLNRLRGIYTDLWELRDDRTEELLFMDSIKPILIILILYYLMVLYGPFWMKDKKPYNLKFFVFIYNMFLATLNFYVFKELAIACYRMKYNWLCEPVRLSKTPDDMRVATGYHLYFVSKIIELFDTVLIVLRRKDNQLSFLHVYHHSTMTLVTWTILRWVPSGSVALAALVNSLVHVFMYSYYGLSVIGPTVRRYLWWKKYLTMIQMFQFIWGFSFIINMFTTGCEFPKWLQYFSAFYLLSYIILFSQFYNSTYRIKKQKKRSEINGNICNQHEHAA
ncbi:hypothetical protein CHUAL_007045 [Chamberlinius hualienensis]